MEKLLDGTECQILLDTGASKSFMSKSHYMFCKSLHSLHRLHPKCREFKREVVSLSVFIHNSCDSGYTWAQI